MMVTHYHGAATTVATVPAMTVAVTVVPAGTSRGGGDANSSDEQRSSGDCE
jgi:hypothetical protein